MNRAVLEAVRGAGFERLGPSHIAFLDQMGGGCRMGELARRLGVTGAAVSQITDQLVALGLVRRVRDPVDGRAVIVEPTELVERGWTVARGAVERIESRWLAELGERRFRAMARAIERLADLDAE